MCVCVCMFEYFNENKPNEAIIFVVVLFRYICDLDNLYDSSISFPFDLLVNAKFSFDDAVDDDDNDDYLKKTNCFNVLFIGFSLSF